MRNMPWHCVAEISKTVSEKMTACVISSTVQFIKSQLCKLAMSSMLIHPRNSTDAGFPMSFSLAVDCWSDSWIVLHDSRYFSLSFWDFMNYAMNSSARHFFQRGSFYQVRSQFSRVHNPLSSSLSKLRAAGSSRRTVKLSFNEVYYPVDEVQCCRQIISNEFKNPRKAFFLVFYALYYQFQGTEWDLKLHPPL